MKLQTKIEFLKGIGPTKAAMLQKELGIFTFGDLLQHYPFRYIDKTKFHRIKDIQKDTNESMQFRGIIRRVEVKGDGRKKRLVARFRDPSGAMDLVWFKGIYFIEKSLVVGLFNEIGCLISFQFIGFYAFNASKSPQPPRF